ncbi:MAG: DUF2298 domain-containing protein [Patescibacteria group bacterium]|nr:DUF2298 domain-containing protein [Patescibacteria group bacterium]
MMPINDLLIVARWELILFVIGILFLPLTFKLFPIFFDKGYIFAKILGIAIISYVIFVLGITHLLPFTGTTIFLVVGFFAVINTLILKKYWKSIIGQCNNWTIIVSFFEELLFFLVLLFWSYVRAHQPDIHGLEKFMDFGFLNSILRSTYFPPRDIWFTPLPINYYYFGHLTTAVLTKISNIPSFITYNLMIATLAAFAFTEAFSIGINLWLLLLGSKKIDEVFYRQGILCGLLTGFLVSFGGNIHTIYSLFSGYSAANPVPFWQMPFAPSSFPNAYWYPDATRFIYHTIHEFPIYSFVVSDLHGHVLDIPFVLLTIAVLMSIIFNFNLPAGGQVKNFKNKNSLKINPFGKLRINAERSRSIKNLKFKIPLISFLLAVMYMTNAWDGAIYFVLVALIFAYLEFIRIKKNKIDNTTNNPILQILPINKKMHNFKYFLLDNWIIDLFIGLFVYLLIIGVGFFLFSLPFNLYFKPFVSGIGIICAPSFLTNIGKIGPILFEKNYCERSPLWQLFILYGFFYFWVIGFLISIRKTIKQFNNLTITDIFVLILIALSTFLIILPELIYLKDIYTDYFRANTMFKLVYQAFIMLSISSGYIIVRLISNIKRRALNIVRFLFLIFAFCLLVLVFIYPYFAINSYYGNLKTYHGLDGISYLKELYPTDYKAIQWLNAHVKGQPVILEAQGDSYTDYARVSANTGLPTVLGWTVHEWLWRGTYAVPAARIPDVEILYESPNLEITRALIRKYNIRYVFIGDLERQKYPNLNINKFNQLGKIVFQMGKTKIYKISF